MKMKMPWSVAWRQRHRRRIVCREQPFFLVEPPHKDLIEPQIGMQDKATARVGLNHVGVRSIVSAEGEAAAGSIHRFSGSNRAGVILYVGRFPQTTIRQDRKDGDAAAKIIRHQKKPATRM